jgi:hypothetical protein
MITPIIGTKNINEYHIDGVHSEDSATYIISKYSPTRATTRVTKKPTERIRTTQIYALEDG